MSVLKPDSPIEFIKGVGPAKAELLKKELKVSVVEDLLFHFPFRYIDRTKLNRVADLHIEGEWVYLKLRIVSIQERGSGRIKVLIVKGIDDTGAIDLVWFRSNQWVKDKIQSGREI